MIKDFFLNDMAHTILRFYTIFSLLMIIEALTYRCALVHWEKRLISPCSHIPSDEYSSWKCIISLSTNLIYLRLLPIVRTHGKGRLSWKISFLVLQQCIRRSIFFVNDSTQMQHSEAQVIDFLHSVLSAVVHRIYCCCKCFVP